MPLGIPHPGGGVVLWIAAPHRPRFGALPSLLCSSVTRNSSEISKAGFFSWVAEFSTAGACGVRALAGPAAAVAHATFGSTSGSAANRLTAPGVPHKPRIEAGERGSGPHMEPKWGTVQRHG